jgi:3-isopropylmalate/(R)-2-methylmalate dehydratase small subunit
VVRFEIDEEVKHRLADGLDDVGITLQDEELIAAFEAGHRTSAPATTSL